MSLKVAVIGTGNVAMGNYLPYLSRQDKLVLGYFNRTREKAEEAARKFGGRVYADLKAVAGWEPDVAFVLTSETCRYEVGQELIDLGVRRAFFEKPLVAGNGQAHVSEEDFQRGKELLTLAREKGCETAMMFNYRFFDQTIAAKKIIADRNFGKMTNVAGLIHYACWPHCIDLVHYFGGNIMEVSALQGAIERQWEQIVAPDLVTVFKLENQATGTLVGTAGMKWQHPLFELTFTFEGGRIHMRDIDGDLEVLDGQGRIHEHISFARDGSRWDQYAASFDKALAAYFDSLRANVPPPVPGLDGLRELQTEAAMRRSINEKRPVIVQEEFKL